jgi:predicted PurR-regulated permease PerM
LRWLAYLAVAAAGAWLIYLLSPILAPFLLAAAIAYLFDPLVDRLEAQLPNVGIVLIGLVLLASFFWR